jgi:hypothetical protein
VKRRLTQPVSPFWRALVAGSTIVAIVFFLLLRTV